MKVQSTEVISRLTEKSAQFLTALSGSVIAVHYYDLNAEAWNFLGKDLQPQAFREISFILLVFLTIGHVIHWLSDYTVHMHWFKKDRIPIGTWDEAGKPDNTEPIVAGLERRIKSIVDRAPAFKELIATINNSAAPSDDNLNQLRSNIDVMNGNLNEMSEILGQLNIKFNKVKTALFFTVFIWYLLVPLMLVGWALWLTYIAGCNV